MIFNTCHTWLDSMLQLNSCNLSGFFDSLSFFLLFSKNRNYTILKLSCSIICQFWHWNVQCLTAHTKPVKVKSHHTPNISITSSRKVFVSCKKLEFQDIRYVCARASNEHQQWKYLDPSQANESESKYVRER